jgi:hypothetical protein
MIFAKSGLKLSAKDSLSIPFTETSAATGFRFEVITIDSESRSAVYSARGFWALRSSSVLKLDFLSFNVQLAALFCSYSKDRDADEFLNIIEYPVLSCPKLEWRNRIRTKPLPISRFDQRFVSKPLFDCSDNASPFGNRERFELTLCRSDKLNLIRHRGILAPHRASSVVGSGA